MLIDTIIAVLYRVGTLLERGEIEQAKQSVRLLKVLVHAERNGGRIELTTPWLPGGGYASIRLSDWNEVPDAIIWLVPNRGVISPQWMSELFHTCIYMGCKVQGCVSTPLPNYKEVS